MAQIDACIYGRKIKKIFDNCLKEIRKKYDIKMIDVEILLYYSENRGKTASDLYRELGLNKGQVSISIDSLCKRSMLVEYVNPSDRRYLKYELSEKGKKVVSVISAETSKVYSAMIVGIDKEKQQTFIEVGEMLCNNINKYLNV